MKKRLLFGLLTSILLSFSALAQVGFTCENPILIASLPFQTIDNTNNYGNSLIGPQVSSCIPGLVNYQSGNDVFYSYTATENTSVSFTLNSTQTRSSMFIYPSCAGTTGPCLAGIGNTNSSPRILNYAVTAGTTYIVVVSSNLLSPTIQYNLLIQPENCPNKPTNLTVSNVTTTGATLSWIAPAAGSVVGYEIAMQPQGSLVPSGSGQYTGIATSNFLVTNLAPATPYQYWVRSECASGVFSAWTGPMVFNTQICLPSNQCTYTFRMTDSANNGWNGARMQIRQNGIVVSTIGNTYISGAGPIDVPVTVCKDLPFDIFWSVAGTQPQQCIVSVINSFGQTIATINGNAATVNSSIYSGVINCDVPLCTLAPSNVTVNPITTTGGTINWNAPETANLGFDVYIVPSGQPMPITTTVPTFSGINGSSAPFSVTIPTLLLPDTAYDFYVRVQCEPINSPWSGVATFTTVATCSKPTNQNVTGITLNSATLGWTEAASATQWEVLLLAAPNGMAPPAPLATPIVGPSDIFIQNSTATTVSPALTTATIYHYYVRSICQPDNDKSTWTGPFIFNTLICNETDKCTYKFLLTNATNNNWNFGRMQVRQNEIVVATLGTGEINNANGIAVALCNDAPFDLYWNVAGQVPQAIGVSIVDVNNDIVFTQLAGQGTPLTVLYSDTILGNCLPPTCPKPTNLSAIVTATSAQLSWTETGSATQWELYAVQAGALQPLNGTPLNWGVSGYYLANTNTNFTISGLNSSTNYRYYVRAICSPTDIGNWNILSPKTFTTTPLNDECSGATALPINPTTVFTQVVSGSTLGGTPSTEISTCPGTENDDVWFSFVATNNIHILSLLNLAGSTTDLRFAVYSGADCTTMTQIFCNASSNNSAVLTTLLVGNTYKIRVYTNGSNVSQSASFNIGVTTPPASATNDECINAIPVTINTLSECVYVTSGNLIGATASVGISGACTGNEDDDVWFSFVATSTTQIINLLAVTGTTTNINHSVFSGTCGNLVQLYCAPANTLSSNSVNFIVGQTYYLRVWSNSSISEIVTFNVCIKPISNCQNAAPFCGGSFGDPYIFPNTTGFPNSLAVACLATVPNPTYYTLNVSESGPLHFTIFQNTNIAPSGQLLGANLDVDFVAWGPFASPESCDQIVFGNCPTCPNNTTNPNFYPLGNIVDCSYSGSFTETISIPNAQAGEYYVILLTNFSGLPGYISLLQTNYDEPNAGATSCGDAIQLVAFVDANNNGLKEATESKFTYGSFTFQKNNIGNTYYISNPMGVQNIYDANTTNTYDFNYEIDSEYAAYYAETPTNFNDLSIAFGSGVQSLYFPITVSQPYNDVDVSIIPLGVPRPGFPFTHKIIYRNLGVLPASGVVTYTKDNANITITAVNPAASSSNSNGFTREYSNLLPGETRSIFVTMLVATIPTVNLGDIISNTVSITFSTNDINVMNNSFTTSQVVVGSYDPNDKNEARGANVQIGQFSQDDYLFYTIRFQNSGTAAAETVRIEDTLNSQYNFASVRMISASHDYTMVRINNKLIWTFNNINLPAEIQDEALSQGYVTFKIKLNPGFVVGAIIPNTAEIYFDFNPPIITNTFQTTFVPNLGLGTFDVNNLMVYPNPAKEIVNIQLKNSTETLQKITIYDMVGKTILSLSANNTQQSSINVGSLARGMYLIEITTDTNLKQVRKFIVN